MDRVIIIGCPGSGKSTFARKLCKKTDIPLYYLDMIYHRPDKSTATREEFDSALSDILQKDKWIIDGNYKRTLAERLEKCDTVFLFDLPTDICLEGAAARIGTKREDMPWVETEFDKDFMQYINDFGKDQLGLIYEMLKSGGEDKNIVIFKSRSDADSYIESLK